MYKVSVIQVWFGLTREPIGTGLSYGIWFHSAVHRNFLTCSHALGKETTATRANRHQACVSRKSQKLFEP